MNDRLFAALGPDDYLDYEPAPIEMSLASARRLLNLLHGINLDDCPILGDGTCQDCRSDAELLEYGRLRLCRRCSSSRRKAGQR